MLGFSLCHRFMAVLTQFGVTLCPISNSIGVQHVGSLEFLPFFSPPLQGGECTILR
jgi:hypothetical protein